VSKRTQLKFDLNRHCPKCGGNAMVTYDKPSGDLHRICETCGYSWNERPLDKEHL
jgi:hypothetical protein